MEIFANSSPIQSDLTSDLTILVTFGLEFLHLIKFRLAVGQHRPGWLWHLRVHGLANRSGLLFGQDLALFCSLTQFLRMSFEEKNRSKTSCKLRSKWKRSAIWITPGAPAAMPSI